MQLKNYNRTCSLQRLLHENLTCNCMDWALGGFHLWNPVHLTHF